MIDVKFKSNISKSININIFYILFIKNSCLNFDIFCKKRKKNNHIEIKKIRRKIKILV